MLRFGKFNKSSRYQIFQTYTVSHHIQDPGVLVYCSRGAPSHTNTDADKVKGTHGIVGLGTWILVLYNLGKYGAMGIDVLWVFLTIQQYECMDLLKLSHSRAGDIPNVCLEGQSEEIEKRTTPPPSMTALRLLHLSYLVSQQF